MKDLHQEFQNSRFFHQARIDQRSVDALIGITAGITADNEVNQSEALFLQRWLEDHLLHLDDPVVNILYRRLNDMLVDNVLDAEEAQELLALLKQFNGGTTASPALFCAPSSLPLNDPCPAIDWLEKSFMFTGTMAYGPRKECEAVILDRGGVIGASVSKKLHFLVIGSVGNEQWLHSSYGTKIKKAVELREAGTPIALVSESHWQNALFG